jgi:hypothetical protein
MFSLPDMGSSFLKSLDFRLISKMRIILAVSMLLVTYIDSTEPRHFVGLTYTPPAAPFWLPPTIRTFPLPRSVALCPWRASTGESVAVWETKSGAAGPLAGKAFGFVSAKPNIAAALPETPEKNSCAEPAEALVEKTATLASAITANEPRKRNLIFFKALIFLAFWREVFELLIYFFRIFLKANLL